MEQLDSAASARVLLAMANAGMYLEEVAERTGIGHATLTRRLSEGSWKLVELGLIAKAVGCPASELMPTEAAA